MNGGVPEGRRGESDAAQTDRTLVGGSGCTRATVQEDSGSAGPEMLHVLGVVLKGTEKLGLSTEQVSCARARE